MTRKTFYTLYGEAMAEQDEEKFVAEWSTSSLLIPDPDAEVDMERIAADLANIWYIANVSARELVNASGLSMAAFARRFCIKIRTLEEWVSGRNALPYHTRYMLAELLGLIEVDIDD